MEFISVFADKNFANAVEHANQICINPIKFHWNSTLFYNSNMHENAIEVDNLRFKLGFDHIELLNSTMEEKQSASLIFSIGNLKALTMTFIFKLSDTKISGKIRISSVLNEAFESTYRLHLTKMKVKSIVSLYIKNDIYCVDHILHEFMDACISLIYRRNNTMIPVYNKIQAKHIKHSFVQYIIDNCTKRTVNIIESKLRNAFNLSSVSLSLGGSIEYRDTLRKHSTSMKLNFSKLVDEIIDSTNLLLLKEIPKIILPNISVILNFKGDEKKSFQARKNSLSGFNFLLRKKSPFISLEDDLVVLYAPVDFADLNIEYKSVTMKCGEIMSKSSNIIEHYKTEGSYFTLSLRSLKENKVDLNLLEFKINNFILLDSENPSHIDASIRLWINSVLEFQVAPLIEETFEKYLRNVLVSEKFTTLSIL